MKKLTKRQKEVLNFILEEVESKNYPPSVREICEKLELRSSSTVHSHLKALQKKGYIRRDPTKPRALAIIDPSMTDDSSQKARLAPIVGQVAAGTPVLAEENIEDYLLLPSSLLKEDTVFLLRVKGESMKDVGILPGDLVIVRQQPVAENGEIVVAMLEDEATVKIFYREKDHIRLKAENPHFEDIITQEAVILGKVIGLFRTID